MRRGYGIINSRRDLTRPPGNDMEMSPSWSRAHDWKSCNRQKRFESSNLSISAKRDKQAETSLFVSFYPTNNQRNAVLERIFKEIRSIFIPKENPKQSAEDIKH